LTVGWRPPVVPFRGAALVTGIRGSVVTPPREPDEIEPEAGGAGVSSVSALRTSLRNASFVLGSSTEAGTEFGSTGLGLADSGKSTSAPITPATVFNCGETGCCCAPQLPQKCSPAAMLAPHWRQSDICLQSISRELQQYSGCQNQ